MNQNGYNNDNLWHSSTPNGYIWVENKPLFTFMSPIVAKLNKCVIRVFENPDPGQI